MTWFFMVGISMRRRKNVICLDVPDAEQLVLNLLYNIIIPNCCHRFKSLAAIFCLWCEGARNTHKHTNFRRSNIRVIILVAEMVGKINIYENYLWELRNHTWKKFFIHCWNRLSLFPTCPNSQIDCCSDLTADRQWSQLGHRGNTLQ